MFNRIYFILLIIIFMVTAGCTRRGDVLDNVVEQFSSPVWSYKKNKKEAYPEEKFQKGLKAFKNKKYRKAQLLLGQYVSAHPGGKFVPEALFLQGECFFLQGINIQAVRYYRKVMEQHPRSSKYVQAALKQGYANIKIGRKKKARELFNLIIAKFPGSVYAQKAQAALSETGNTHKTEQARIRPFRHADPKTIHRSQDIEQTQSEQKIFVIPEKEVKNQKTENCIDFYPNRYLMAIGASEYKNMSELTYIENDIKYIKQLARCYIGVPEENIYIQMDPTYMELKRSIDNFKELVEHNDALIIFYYSGHGLQDTKGNPYIVPIDARIKSERNLKENAFSLNFLLQELAGIPSKSQIIFWDACRTNMPWKPVTVVTTKMHHTNSNQTVVFTSQAAETSNISKQTDASAFIFSLFKIAQSGLANLDKNESGYVEIDEIEPILKIRLRNISADNSQQIEIVGNPKVKLFPLD